MSTSTSSFDVGSEFNSFEEFDRAKQKYELENHVQFVIGQCRTVETENKRIKGQPYDLVLKYQNVDFKCKHFGEVRHYSKRTFERPNQSTYKINCGAMLVVKAQRLAQKLKITKFEKNHNHDLDPDMVIHCPERKKATEEEQEDLEDFMALHPLTGTLTEYCRGKFDKPGLIPRDIRNRSQKITRERMCGATKAEDLINYFTSLQEEDPNGIYQIAFDQRETVSSIFLMTSQMIRLAQTFPEIIIMDSTYKVNENLMPLFVINIMDSFGSGRVIGYGCVANEEKENVICLLEALRRGFGEKAEEVKTFLIDKDPSEIASITTVFPEAQIHLSLFHVIKTFRKIVRSTGEPESVKDTLLDILTDMLYCRTQERYDELYEMLQDTAPEETLIYFNDNWHKSVLHWTHMDRLLSPNMGQETTNVSECKNSKIKEVVKVCDTVKTMFKKLLMLEKNKDVQTARKIYEATYKRAYVANNPDELIQQVVQDCTPFAANSIRRERDFAVPECLQGRHDSSSESCNCSTRIELRLLCRHMIAHRIAEGLPWYKKEDVPDRWRLDKCRRVLNQTCGEKETVSWIRMPLKIRPVHPQQRYSETLQKFKEICSVMSMQDDKTFAAQSQLLADLLNFWREGKTVHLVTVESSGATVHQPQSMVTIQTETSAANARTENDSHYIKKEVHGPPENSLLSSLKEPLGLVPPEVQGADIMTGNLCCGCGSETSGAHRCRICSKCVHAIENCSVAVPGSLEGYGQERMCNQCSVDHIQPKSIISMDFDEANDDVDVIEIVSSPECLSDVIEIEEPESPTGNIDGSRSKDKPTEIHAQNPPSNPATVTHFGNSSILPEPPKNPKLPVRVANKGRRTVRKMNDNRGKEFLGCHKTSVKEQCNYFRWVEDMNLEDSDGDDPPPHDDPPSNDNAASNSSGSNQCVGCGLVTSGAHRCNNCSKCVHAIDSCSVEAPGSSEGYGQKRVCKPCSGAHNSGVSISPTHTQPALEEIVQPQDVPTDEKCLVCFDYECNTKCMVCGKNCHKLQEEGRKFCSSSFDNGDVCKFCLCLNCLEPLSDSHMCLCHICEKKAETYIICQECRYAVHRICTVTSDDGYPICASCQLKNPTDKGACGGCFSQIEKPHVCRCYVCDLPAPEFRKCKRCSRAIHLHCMDDPSNGFSLCQSCTCSKVSGLPLKLVRDVLENGKLTDAHMAAASGIISRQYEHLKGLRAPISCEGDLSNTVLEKTDRFSYEVADGKHDYVQIIHTGYDHWITAIVMKGTKNVVQVCNSSGSQSIGSFVESQLALMLKCNEHQFRVVYPFVKQQPFNTNDAALTDLCGPLALAYAVDFAETGMVQYVDFDQHQLRQHLYNCLQEGKFTKFPETSNPEAICKNPPSEIVKVYCECRMPGHFDSKMITCSKPKCPIKDFHFKCVNIEKTPTKRHWSCSNCQSYRR